MKLQTKILLSIITLIVTPMGFMGWFAYSYQSANVRQALIEQMKSTSNQLENQVLKIIQTAKSNVDLFANSELLKTYMIFKDEEERYLLAQPPLLRLFSSYQKAYPHYSEIRVILPNGLEDVRSTVGDIPNKTENEQDSWLFKMITTSREINTAFFTQNPDNGKHSLYVSKKLMYRDNEYDPVMEEPVFRGYLVVTVDLDNIKKQVERIKIGRDGYVFFMDTPGHVVIHKDPSKIDRDLPLGLLEQLLPVAQKRGIHEIRVQDKNYLVNGSRIQSDLFIFSLLAEMEVNSASNRLALIIFFITLFTVLFSIGIIFTILKMFIFNRIDKLNDAIKKVSTGDLTIDYQETQQDEISNLLYEFNLMTRRLKDLTVSRKYVDKIFSSMTEALIVINSNGQIKTANKRARELLEYMDQELMDMHVSNIFSGKQDSKIVQMMIHGEIKNMETELIPKNGPVIPVLLSSTSILKVEKDIEGIICVFRDIRDIQKAEKERKRLERKLQQSEKMEMIGTLAGGVAHDLNNILSGVISYPELLLMDLPEDSRMRKAIETIKTSGEKAAAIVEDLLTLARRGVVTKDIANLNLLIQEFLISLEHQKILSFHPEVNVETSLQKDLFSIQGSSIHLTKTIMNLVSNAAEAMNHGGVLRITTENCYIDQPIEGYDDIEEGDYSVLKISDQGIGISEEDKKRIFEPFFTKKVMGRSGTGLGMSVVWGTVKDHHGYIDVQSKVGKGSTFTLYFPACRDAVVKSETAPSVENFIGAGERILVVDDVSEQREIASAMLTRLGYNVQTAASGEEAVDLLEQSSYDLAVLDMIMPPGMDGLDTYKAMLKLSPNLPAIITSGFSETDRVKQVLELGAVTYIKKPYNIAVIGQTIQSSLEKSNLQ